MRGRKPSLRVIEAAAEANTVQELPAPPAHIPPMARPEWKRVTTDLAERGLLTETCLPLVAAYVLATWQIAVAVKAIKKDGAFVRTKMGEPKPHPAQAMMSRAQDTIVRLGSELGLSPAARARSVFRQPAQREAEDDWDDMGL